MVFSVAANAIINAFEGLRKRRARGRIWMLRGVAPVCLHALQARVILPDTVQNNGTHPYQSIYERQRELGQKKGARRTTQLHAANACPLCPRASELATA